MVRELSTLFELLRQKRVEPRGRAFSSSIDSARAGNSRAASGAALVAGTPRHSNSNSSNNSMNVAVVANSSSSSSGSRSCTGNGEGKETQFSPGTVRPLKSSDSNLTNSTVAASASWTSTSMTASSSSRPPLQNTDTKDIVAPETDSEPLESPEVDILVPEITTGGTPREKLPHEFVVDFYDAFSNIEVSLWAKGSVGSCLPVVTAKRSLSPVLITRIHHFGCLM